MFEMNVWQSFLMVVISPPGFIIISRLVFQLVFYLWKTANDCEKSVSAENVLKLAMFFAIFVPIFWALTITQAFFIAHLVKAAQVLTAYMMG